jgi:branched-chain amino acid transport system ATP-binding protein
MTMLSLETMDLAVSYGGVHALQGVSVRVKPGEIHGLIGPNGSGKSTFVDAVSGRRRPDRGRIMLFGEDITSLSIAGRRRRGVARSFQRSSIFPKLTVRHQIDLALERFQSHGSHDVLSTFGLDWRLDAVAEDMSYGEQKRLDLSLALVGHPKVILLDEPAAGLSKDESAILARHLKGLAQRNGIAVLLIEHDMDVVFGICDAITVFESGKVLAEGAPPVVRADHRVRIAYLGSEA